MLLKLAPTLLLLVFALGMGSRKPDLLPAPPKPNTGVEELPARSERLIKLEVTSLKGFDGLQETRFRNIVANTEKVVNLKAFEVAVKSHIYKGKNYFVDTTDTPEAVFNKVTSANWKLEYRLEALSILSKTIGYTYPSVTWIAFNSRKWYSLSDAEISANICHEYGGHKFGRYNHSQQWNEARDYSAPYGLGTICKNLYKRIVK